MAYEICMVKLVTGEMVLGKLDKEARTINDPAILQMIPSQQGGVQMMLMPYGYPFENDFTGSISLSHVLYDYKNAPEELKTKYMEAISNLTLSGGALSGLDLKNPGGAPAGGDIASLLRSK